MVYETGALKAVAPLAGAWIEIVTKSHITQGKTSLPSRERGLKSEFDMFYRRAFLSLPSRERGLK